MGYDPTIFTAADRKRELVEEQPITGIEISEAMTAADWQAHDAILERARYEDSALGLLVRQVCHRITAKRLQEVAS
jgi:hypothetical protein